MTCELVWVSQYSHERECLFAPLTGFELQQTVPLPNWPHMKDELTIWKRRAEALPVVL